MYLYDKMFTKEKDMITYVLFNPIASNNQGVQKAKEIEKMWADKNLNYVDLTTIEDYPTFLSRLNADDEIVLCGGDGTINKFVNNVDGKIPENDIYYYACGTGNDFWTDLGKVKGDAPEKINQYLVDLPKVIINGKENYFINGVGFGIDGYCCEEGDKQKQKSDKPVNYTSIAIKGLLFKFKPRNAKVIVDGKEYDFKKVWVVPTMHGRFYGGGMNACPDQQRNNQEGTLSLMKFGGAGRLATLIVFPKIFKGEHVKSKQVEVFTGKEITVKFDMPTALQIDGETVLGVTEYTVKSGKA